jgi:hypothetical protein
MRRWDWDVRAFYAKGHERAGQQAFGVVLANAHMCSMELEVAAARPEIGRVIVRDLRQGAGAKWVTAYCEEHQPTLLDVARVPGSPAPGNDEQRTAVVAHR